MVSTLVSIIVLGSLGLLWLEGARARELAVSISKAACQKEGYQLLDDSVYLQRIGLRWTACGLRFRRMYRFEYSVEGTLREAGYILLLGSQLESVHIKGRDTIEQPTATEEEAAAEAKIIPFPRRK